MQKAILILGAGPDQMFMINTAKELGLLTVAVDGNPEAPGLKVADYSRPISFADVPAVIVYVKELLSAGVNVAGVTTMGSDVPHLLAEIANFFSWAGPSMETGRLATDKYAMKKCFEEHGIPVPSFELANGPEAVNRIWRDWGVDKVVLKPTDRAGSRGVSVLCNTFEIQRAWDSAKTNSISGHVLLEEYIDGPQISTESILFDEYAVTPGFADRVYDGMDVYWPQIIENGGWVPSREDSRTRERVTNLVHAAARALGIKRGVAKGDVVISPQRGPMVIEMAARLSGGDFCESLVPLGTGVNYVKDVLQIAIGGCPDWQSLIPRHHTAVANRYFFLPAGRLEEVRGEVEVQSRSYISKFQLFYQVSDEIPVIENHGQRVGVFVATAESRSELQRRIDEVYEVVRFLVNGTWYSGRPGSFLNK